MPVNREEFLNKARKRQMQESTVEERLEGLTPEQILTRVPPEQRLAGLTPEDRETLRRLLDTPSLSDPHPRA